MSVDTSTPNHLIIDQQECGCPCPDASITKGKINIPTDISTQYPNLLTTQINLDVKDFNEPYNFELGYAKLFVIGQVVGADSVLCDPTNCELVPRFKVEEWALIDSVARAWIFPRWAGLLFIMNLIFFAPALTITEIVRQVRKRKVTLAAANIGLPKAWLH